MSVSESGEYQCVAGNVLGETRASVVLHISGAGAGAGAGDTAVIVMLVLGSLSRTL